MSIRVHEVMDADPPTVDPTATVAEARSIAEREGVRHLVVATDHRIVGVVEEDGLWLAAEDVLRTAAGMQGSLTDRESRPVRSAMRSAVPSVSPNEALSAAARLMLLKHRTALPVVDGGRLVGMLTVDGCRRAVGAPLMAVQADDSDAASSAQGSARSEDVA